MNKKMAKNNLGMCFILVEIVLGSFVLFGDILEDVFERFLLLLHIILFTGEHLPGDNEDSEANGEGVTDRWYLA